MFKKYVVFIMIPAIVFLLMAESDRISYGVLYIENKTDWELKITAQVKDEWDVVTNTEWEIPARGAEKIDNLYRLSNVRFQPMIDDDAETAAWLKVSTPLLPERHQQAKDLIVTIAKNPYADQWKVDQLYVASAKIEYGGQTGYHVKILGR